MSRSTPVTWPRSRPARSATRTLDSSAWAMVIPQATGSGAERRFASVMR
ncbi:MAG: hypothetical protein ACYDFT_02545 [Thermoplasmata archaeon]